MATLPVDPHWRCQRSAECCTKPPSVTMTEQEAQLLVQYAEAHLPIATLVKIRFQRLQPGFVSLDAGPCPLLKGVECGVYPVRPYSCRRFACMRPDVATEPLQMEQHNPLMLFGAVGCANLRKRLLQSRAARRLYDRIQRHAQRWAVKHGWKEDAA